jgi:hypothetical protein
MSDAEIELSFDKAHAATAVIHGEHPNGHAFDGNVNPYASHTKGDDDDASVGAESEDELNAVLPVADAHGQPAHFPGQEDHHHKAGKDLLDEDAKKEAPRSVIAAGLESFKYLYSMGLLIFSVFLVMAAIFAEQTKATSDGLHPAIAFFVFWFLILLLATMEGGQGDLVGLQPIDKELYKETHPITHKNTVLAHKGDNMERFIVGRQFLVVLVVFVSNMMSSSIEDIDVLGLNKGIQTVFYGSGVALILVTIMLGQLTAQVNAANCMLDFINNYFMLYFVTYVSLAIEMSGLLHSVYLVQIFFSKISGSPIESNEPPRSRIQNVFFWARVLFSSFVLAYAFAVTLSALFDGKTTMWDGIPSAVSVVVFFVLMCFVGMMEGMQIALFAVVNLPEDELAQHTIAHANCQLTFTGQNLQKFLIGRQICVTVCMFVVARITTLDIEIGVDDNVFGVSDSMQEFFNTGLLGAVITTIVASLAWRIIASSFPVAFLSNPLIYVIIRLCLALEASGLCSASWVLARFHKPMAGYQPDEVHLEGAAPHNSEPVNRRDKDIDRLMTVLRFTYSFGLLVFSIIIVMTAMFTDQTSATGDRGLHPILAFVIFWFLIIWLAFMEGGQGCLVGLQPIFKEKYSASHPKTLKNTMLAHKGDNMGRVIIGRQFLVVLVVFVSNLMASGIEGASVLGLPDVINDIFLSTGVALILITIMLGQLTAQVNGANCMLDFINNYFMLYFVTYVSLAIEMSGLLHSVYLVQIFFSKISGTPIESREPPRNGIQSVFFWTRVLFSLFILAYAFAVTLGALFDGKTTMWSGIPSAVSVVVFFVLMCFVGMMEGMQIALFAVINLPEEALAQHTIAKANCDLAFTGNNLQKFLIGRQICVTVCTFIVARITTLDIEIGVDDNIFGVTDSSQEFFNTGLLGAVITTIVASLAWRIIASSFPVVFLSNPLIYVIIRICLLLEASGLCSAALLLALIHKQIAGYQADEVYIGTSEELATDTKEGDDLELAESGTHTTTE